jgi:phosphoribosyl 1,2-cyclic phosphodiesterase
MRARTLWQTKRLTRGGSSPYTYFMLKGEIVVYCLASGSSGNAFLVTIGEEAVLIDAGLGVRTLLGALERFRIAPSKLAGILLTHEHIDHVRGAISLARKTGAPLISSKGTLSALLRPGSCGDRTKSG